MGSLLASVKLQFVAPDHHLSFCMHGNRFPRLFRGSSIADGGGFRGSADSVS